MFYHWVTFLDIIYTLSLSTIFVLFVDNFPEFHDAFIHNLVFMFLWISHLVSITRFTDFWGLLIISNSVSCSSFSNRFFWYVWNHILIFFTLLKFYILPLSQIFPDPLPFPIHSTLSSFWTSKQNTAQQWTPTTQENKIKPWPQRKNNAKLQPNKSTHRNCGVHYVLVKYS